MGATGLLTILTIFISIYGLFPEEKQQDIKLRISRVDLVIVSIPVIAILIVIFSPVILSVGYIEPIEWRWGFTEDTMEFSCLLGIILFFGCKRFGSKLPAANYARWAKVSEEYLRGKKFEQLDYLLSKYHEQLFNVINNQVWYVRVHNYLLSQPVLVYFAESPEIPFYKRPFWYWLRRLLGKLFPSRSKRQDIVESSISWILKSKSFVVYLAEMSPLVAAKATCVHFWVAVNLLSYFLRL